MQQSVAAISLSDLCEPPSEGGGIQIQPSVVAISLRDLGEEGEGQIPTSAATIALCDQRVPVNEGDVPLEEGASLPAGKLQGILKGQRSRSTEDSYLRSPHKVQLQQRVL